MTADHYLKTAVAVGVGVFLGMAAFDEAAGEGILGPVALLVGLLLLCALVIGGWAPAPTSTSDREARREAAGQGPRTTDQSRPGDSNP